MLDVEPRPQVTIEQWDTDLSGFVHGVQQRVPQNGELTYLPREKIVYVVDDSLNDSPQGLGLFRHLVEISNRLEKFELLEAYGYETDLRGVPIGRAPYAGIRAAVNNKTMTTAQANTALQNLKGFIEKHIKNPRLGLMLDSAVYSSLDDAQTPSQQRQWDVEILKGEGALSSEAVAKAIDRLNREMAIVLGVEGLLLGSNKTGSFALSKDKSHNFALIVDSTLQELADSFASDLVTRIFDLNGWDRKLTPKLKPDATRYRDIEQITGALKDMSQAGAILMPNDPVISEVRDLMGVERPPEISLEDMSTLLRPPGGEPAPEEEEEVEEEDDGEA
jgi:hypothetical protein